MDDGLRVHTVGMKNCHGPRKTGMSSDSEVCGVLNSKTKKMYCVFMQELNIFALHLDKWLLPLKVSLEVYFQI